MNDVLSSFGRLFVFTTLLPGLVGYLELHILFPDCDLLPTEFWGAILASYGLGVVANAIGHFAEWIRVNPKSPDAECDVYGWHVFKLQTHKIGQSSRVDHFLEYSENLRAWYWNSAFMSFSVCVGTFAYAITSSAYEITAPRYVTIGVGLVTGALMIMLNQKMKAINSKLVRKLMTTLGRETLPRTPFE